MSLPDFELGPLEMMDVHPSEPKIAPATARVQLGSLDYLLRLCQGRSRLAESQFFFRLNFPLSPVVTNNLQSSAEALKAVVQHEEILHSWFSKYVMEENFSRKMSFCGSDSGQVMGLSIGEKVCHWSKSLRSSGGTPFELPYQRNGSLWIIEEPDNIIIGKVEQALNDEKSDCAFSWRWAQSEWKDNQRIVSQFKRGDFDEFVQVIRWLTQSHSAFQEKPLFIEWLIFIQSCLEDESRGTGSYQDLPRAIATSTQKLDNLLNVVHDYFLPSYDDTLKRYSIIKHISRVSNFQIYVGVSIPTQHERLEARLNLREWLADKVAPEEIPALLGES